MHTKETRRADVDAFVKWQQEYTSQTRRPGARPETRRL